MRMRAGQGIVTIAAALALILPAGAAVAQPRQPGASGARAGDASTSAALRAGQGMSLTSRHLVTGVVRDLSGRSLGGVCVLTAGADGVVREARTSADGRYEMSLPHPGTYAVSYRDCETGKAGAPMFTAAAARQIQIGAATLTALPAATVRLASQPASDNSPQAAGITLPREGRILRPGSAAGRPGPDAGESGPPDVGGVAGRVTNPAGQPLAGVCAWVIEETRQGGFAEGHATSRNGTYKIGEDDFYPGRFLVLFTSNCGGANVNPFVPIAPGPWAAQWYKGKFAQSKATKVRLRAHKVTRGIDAVMQRGGEVSGTIYGADHRPLEHGCAVLTSASGEEFGQAVANPTGEYTITGLDPGSYRVTGLGSCSGMSDYAQTWYPHAASLRTAQVIKVRLGHRTRGINMTLEQLGTVTGIVRFGGRTGRPLGGVCVSVTSPTNMSDFGSATSGKNGEYVVDGLPAGRYQVQAYAGCGNSGNYLSATYPHRVHVADGRTTSGINLYMQDGGTLTGTVTAAATGRPLAGICVFDENGDGAVSGKNGAYTIDELPTERTTVSFNGGCGNRGSYAPQNYDNQVAVEAAREVRVTAGQVTAGINAAMLPGATIAGWVTSPHGRPVPGVCVEIVPAGQSGFGIYGGSATTNKAGSYVEANLAPGGYAVAFFSGCLGPSNAAQIQWFKGQPAAAAAGLVDVSAGADASGIDAVVSPAGAIAGTVHSVTGRPIDFDCMTAISRRTGQASGFQSSLGSGTYTISSLAPGTYTVVAEDCYAGSSFAPGIDRHPVTVRAGVTTRKVTLTLSPGGVVAGRITKASNGQPDRGACVEATPVSGSAAEFGLIGVSVTSHSGRYKITGLRTGSYRIQVYPNCGGFAMTLPHLVRVTQGKVTAGVNASLPAAPATGSIAGLVTGPGAAAVPGACVEAYQIPGGLVGMTTADARGRYRVTGLTPGRYKIEFGDPSCSDSPADLGTQWFDRAAGSGAATVITVTAGHTVSAINGTLPADGTITGTVTGTSASPLTGVCVSAVPAAKDEQADFTVSAAGAYTLADLQPGRYRVEFQAGCGKTGVITQWWQHARSRRAAKIITVSPGDTVSRVDAVMRGT